MLGFAGKSCFAAFFTYLALSSADPVNDRLRTELEAAQAANPTNPMIKQAAAIDRSTWKATADSANSGNPASNVLDSSTSTIWHSQYSPNNAPLPHTITIDMQTTQNVNGFVYTPRQDGNSNGNIGQHQVQVSSDNKTWTTVAFGTYLDDSEIKTTPFTTIPARYIRIVAQTEAGNRGPWTSAADISITTASYTALSATQGVWGPTIEFPTVPAAATLEHDSGKVLIWSSFLPNDFSGGTTGVTLTSTYDPATSTVSSLRTVSNIKHDMFCPGLSLDAKGRPVVTGGNTAPATSTYDQGTDAWTANANMQIARGYQAQVTLSDGRIFTIGGSWSGGEGGKNGEVYNTGTNAWSLLSGCPVAPILTADQQGVYRADNHAWLFGWKNGYVFQAGPSKAMNWYSTSGSGSQMAAGTRGSDADAMCGDAVMYDAVAGKILAVGGSPYYQDSNATPNANLITINTPGTAATVTALSPMANPRAFANGVVLPNGQVLIMGGQTFPIPFSDDTSIFVAELWDPTTQKFTTMNPAAAPRNYHSVGLLLPDATVFNGGGGLCGSCGTNHRDAQIFSPPYLFTSSGAKATRPVISSVSATTLKAGASFTATTGGAVASFALIRNGATTHTVNTDQRRIPLAPTSSSGTTYSLKVPSDAGIAIPGYYMLFALDAGGVPSVSKSILVTN